VISEGLFHLMLTTPSVNDLVNGSIHHGSLRKGYTLPAIRFSEVASTPIVTSQGTANLQYKTFQFDAFASTYLDAHRLRDAMRSLLADFAGSLAEGTVVHGSILKNELDDPLEEGKSGYINRCLLDIQFSFEREQ
jgi:hypothetical protein